MPLSVATLPPLFVFTPSVLSPPFLLALSLLRQPSLSTFFLRQPFPNDARARSLYLSLTHTHTLSLSHTHTRSHSLTLTLSLWLLLSRSLSLWLSRTRTLSLSRARSLSRGYWRTTNFSHSRHSSMCEGGREAGRRACCACMGEGAQPMTGRQKRGAGRKKMSGFTCVGHWC
jgi:hypothetical protein